MTAYHRSTLDASTRTVRDRRGSVRGFPRDPRTAASVPPSVVEPGTPRLDVRTPARRRARRYRDA